MRIVISVAACLAVCVAQSSQAAPPAAPANDSLPALEHWTPAQADPSVNACTDFFQHACGTWMKANPIPADQAASGTFDKLFLWNVAAVHLTLEEAVNARTRTPVQQKAGDYYAACMDEAAIDRTGLSPLQPLLDRIGSLTDKSQLPEVLASIHQVIRPPNLNFIEAQSPGILFGVWATPDFDDATSMLAALDQSGMGLPGREFYLNDDAKSQEIRAQYAAYVTRMLALSGESAEQAASDAKAVLVIETGLARSAMDIVARRDPKKLNNKRTLTEVQSLTPSFDWPRYFAPSALPRRRATWCSLPISSAASRS